MLAFSDSARNAFAKGITRGSTVLKLAIIALILSFAWYAVNRPLADPKITGELSAFEREHIHKILANIDTQRFLHLVPKQITARLNEIPWVASSSVWRDFPWAWTVWVKRAKPIAIWHDKFYLDKRARILLAVEDPTAFSHLPKLNGTPESALKVLTHYHAFQVILKAHNAPSIRTLELDAQEQWHIIGSNNIYVILPTHNARDVLQRFARAYNYLGQTNARMIKKVNLHYVNGMAIEWGASS